MRTRKSDIQNRRLASRKILEAQFTKKISQGDRAIALGTLPSAERNTSDIYGGMT
jgi:hypothetical protein